MVVASAAPAQTPRVLTLEQALRTARERQPQIRQAQAAARAADARVDEARAGWLPQVSASAAYQRTTANFIPRPSLLPVCNAGQTTNCLPPGNQANNSWDTANFFNNSLTVNQLIWDFGQTTGRLHSTQAQADAFRSSERNTQQQIDLVVRSSFFDARANKALVKVAAETLDNQVKHLEQVDAFVHAGTRPDIDLFQSRTDVANAKVQLINAQNSYGVSRAQLNQAMGVEQDTDYDVADDALPALANEDASTDDLMPEALKARPDVLAIEQQVKALLNALSSIRGAYWPTFAASAGATQGGTKLDDLGWNVQAGVSLTWNLYQGGFTTGQVHEAEANVAAQVAALDSLRLQVRLDVDQARLALRAAKASTGAAAEALLNARERLKLAEGRYQTGIGSIIELDDAQVAVTTAAAQAVQADYRVATARAQLAKALGRP
jgi:outer membrane protein